MPKERNPREVEKLVKAAYRRGLDERARMEILESVAGIVLLALFVAIIFVAVPYWLMSVSPFAVSLYFGIIIGFVISRVSW